MENKRKGVGEERGKCREGGEKQEMEGKSVATDTKRMMTKANRDTLLLGMKIYSWTKRERFEGKENGGNDENGKMKKRQSQEKIRRGPL